jgi:DNA-binding response OmpR family regulator
VGKPFAFADLVARCRALLSPTKIPEDCLRQGEVELDPASHVVRSHGTEIPLSEIETSILKFMLSHPRDIATTDMLARQIWKEKALSVSLRPAIESQMQRLNQKIITGLGVPWIRSVQGIGYALENSVFSTTRVGAQP